MFFFSITGASGTCSQDPLGANFNTRYCGQRLAPVIGGSTNIPICGKYLPNDLLIRWFHEYFDTTNLRIFLLLLTFTVYKNK